MIALVAILKIYFELFLLNQKAIDSKPYWKYLGDL